METDKSAPVIDRVIYNFRKNDSLNIDVVPIAETLLTEKSKVQTTAPGEFLSHHLVASGCAGSHGRF